MKYVLYVIMLATFSSAFADEVISMQMTPPKWKTSYNSYYYEFDGTKAQKDNLYSFGETTLKMQFMSLSYQTESGWILSALAQYYETYVITKLPGFGVYHDQTRGAGDTILSGSKALYMNDAFMLFTDAGASLPTGSIDEKNPSSTTGARYPYNMQMGSGTVDGVFGIMPLYLQPKYQLGARASATIRGGYKNSAGYELGNLYRLDAWADYPLKYGFTPRLVGYYKNKNGIDGADKSFARTPYVEYYHHDQIDWNLSAALKYQYAFTPKVSFNSEVGVPVEQGCQNYDDVVVSTRYYVNLGVTGQF
jgi:hypothetical protein